METFPILKRKDEKKHGEYRTKRVILEIYDEMAKVMGTGVKVMKGSSLLLTLMKLRVFFWDSGSFKIAIKS